MRAALALVLALSGCVGGDDDDDSGVPPVEEHCSSWSTPGVLGNVEEAELDEISGMVASRAQPGVLWVIEDSGNEPWLWALAEDGGVLARYTVEDNSNRDWEDLALGPCEAGTCLFIADVGDNNAVAESVALLRLPEPQVPEPSTGDTFTGSVAAARLPFTYPEGPRDAEALVVRPDGVPVVLSKDPGGTAEFFALPDAAPGVMSEAVSLGERRLAPVGSVSLGVTAADLLPDGERMVVRGYFDLREFTLSAGPSSAELGSSRALTIPGGEAQGESVAYDPVGRRILTVGEAQHPPIFQLQCQDP